MQSTIFDDCVVNLVNAAFEGFNATILAYGQTVTPCYKLCFVLQTTHATEIISPGKWEDLDDGVFS